MKIIKAILKTIISILVIPPALVVGAFYGLMLMMAYMFGLPVALVVDLWE